MTKRRETVHGKSDRQSLEEKRATTSSELCLKRLHSGVNKL